MSTLCDPSRSILIVIDMQERLMPAIQDGTEVINRARILAEAAKLLGVPVVGTAQSSSRLGPNVAEIDRLFDITVEKDNFDACAADGFMEVLDPARDDMILVGCEAHICVLQTALSLIERKRRVRVIADAVGSRRRSDKTAALSRATAGGAEVITSEMVIFEWMKDSNHPRFRDVLRLIK